MHRTWHCRLQVTQQRARLLVSAPDGDVLKARLDTRPCHPRALLTLLEGLSLWQGHSLSVALSAGQDCHGSLPSMLFGDELWPAESGLVRFVVADRGPRRARLAGLGDFRALRRGAR